MGEHKPKKKAPSEPRKFGWIAEYTDEHSLLEAAQKVRDSGYTKTDAFTPYPVHGIDHALGIKPTILPFIVLVAGFTGLTTAFVMEYWTNAIDYPYIISGKPYGSWPAFIPVGFELTVLFSAFTSFLGMIALNRLPKFSNPVFSSARFDRATDDRFFLYIDAADKYYNRQSVQDLLSATKPESLEEVVEDSTPSEIPRFIWFSLICLVIASWIPAVIVLKMRSGKSGQPRWHVFFDMDFQPKKKPQQSTTIFADGRVMRPQVVGTVARGQLNESDPYYLGYDPGKLALIEETKKVYVGLEQPPAEVAKPEDGSAPAPASGSAGAEKSVPAAEAATVEAKPAEVKPAEAPVQATTPAAAPADGAGAPPAAAPGLNLPWVTEIPGEITPESMALGKRKFETYCAACHGLGGDGDGLVAQRADQLAQGYWLPPTSMHDQRVRDQAVGQIFFTITNGKGKMAGYGPSLDAKERWAIVQYVRALQRSRNAKLEDVPEADRSKIVGTP